LQVIPAVIGLITVLVILKKRFSLGTALVAGAMVTALGAGYGFLDTAGLIWRVVTSASSMRLITLVIFSALFSYFLNHFGLLEKMVHTLEEWIPYRSGQLMLIPALIAMCLFTPGGAMTSASMIESLLAEEPLSAGVKSGINLWFRVAGRLVVPFIPSLILVAELGGVNPRSVILTLLPVTAGAFAFGYLFLLRPLHLGVNAGHTGVLAHPGAGFRGKVVRFVQLGYPYLPLITVTAIALLTHVSFVVALLIGIVLIIAIGVGVERRGFGWAEVRAGIDLGLLWMIIGIVVFRGVLVESRSVEPVVEFLVRVGFPAELLFFLVPMGLSVLLASIIATIGISMPLLLPFFASSPAATLYVSFIYLTATSGFHLSPFNIDSVFTRRYFNSSLRAFYRRFVPPMVATLLLAVLVAWGGWFKAIR